MIDQDILYSECPCGSGKKFKFCCYPSIRDDLPRDPTRADVTDAIRMRSRATRLAELTAKSGGTADVTGKPKAYCCRRKTNLACYRPPTTTWRSALWFKGT